MARSPQPLAERPRAAALAGIVAAAAALALTELVAALLSDRSAFVAVADAVIDLTPGSLVAAAIDLLGDANRLALRVGILVVAAVAGAIVGVAASRRPAAAPVGIGLFSLIGIASGLRDPLLPALPALLAPIIGGAGGTALLWWLVGALARTPSPPPSMGQERDRERRRLLGAAAATAGLALLAGAGGRLLRDGARGAGGGGGSGSAASGGEQALDLPTPATPLPDPPADAAFAVDGLAPLVTPNRDFYRIDTAFSVPRIDAASHTVAVTGLVDRPLELSYAELLELADTEADVTLACVSNEVGGDLVGNARWQGVPLAELLDRAGVQAEATQVVGRAVDGWTAGFPIEAARDGRPALVAVGMNGEPLPRKHGFPVRLVIAGLYGYVSDTKWLDEIELTTFEEFDAYWIRRGWARFGPIKTQSRIDVPRRGAELAAGEVVVAGVAWDRLDGITAVEVSVDDEDWQPAELAAELATTTWRQWRWRWPAEPGEHVLRVRATDGRGEVQTSERTPVQPDGATGHHEVRVRVV